MHNVYIFRLLQISSNMNIICNCTYSCFAHINMHILLLLIFHLCQYIKGIVTYKWCQTTITCNMYVTCSKSRFGLRPLEGIELLVHKCFLLLRTVGQQMGISVAE